MPQKARSVSWVRVTRNCSSVSCARQASSDLTIFGTWIGEAKVPPSSSRRTVTVSVFIDLEREWRSGWGPVNRIRGSFMWLFIFLHLLFCSKIHDRRTYLHEATQIPGRSSAVGQSPAPR